MKKKIALDLDGVVFDSETLYRVYAEIYDVDVMHGNNILYNYERTFQKRYNWSEEQAKKLYNSCYKEVMQNASIMPGADIVIEKLKEDYDFFIVTARPDNEIELSYKKLKELNLDKVKIINDTKDKIEVLKRENAYAIIDDDINTCKAAKENEILALFFRNAAYEQSYQEKNFIPVNNWGEVYKCLKLRK